MAWPDGVKEIELWMERRPCCICEKLTRLVDTSRNIAVCSAAHWEQAKPLYPITDKF